MFVLVVSPNRPPPTPTFPFPSHVCFSVVSFYFFFFDCRRLVWQIVESNRHKINMRDGWVRKTDTRSPSGAWKMVFSSVMRAGVNIQTDFIDIHCARIRSLACSFARPLTICSKLRTTELLMARLSWIHFFPPHHSHFACRLFCFQFLILFFFVLLRSHSAVRLYSIYTFHCRYCLFFLHLAQSSSCVFDSAKIALATTKWIETKCTSCSY